MTSLVGKTLGKYRLVARLGQGGMAEVYKAYQPGLNRYVSIKVLYTHMLDDKNFVGRFEREALAVGKLRHPNIVQAFDFDREGDLYFLAMEFIDGPTLKEELEARHAAGKPFTLKEIARIFCSLGSAIDYAHTRGMIHRDLKPANVMINPEGQVVLTDFGIARIMDSTTYTQTGALSGTPYYMSPEQAQGQHGDERSDIYSLGVMIYEVVTGAVPYQGDTPFKVIWKHIHEPVPPPTRVVSGLPIAIERTILKAMNKNPGERYQRAGELIAVLRATVGLTPEEIYLPLTIIAPRPQIKEIDHATGVFPSKEKNAPVDLQSTQSVRAGPWLGDTVAQATPTRRPPRSPLAAPILIMSGLLIFLLIVGLGVGAFLLKKLYEAELTPPPVVVTGGPATATMATATTAVVIEPTATAQIETATAVLPTPTQINRLPDVAAAKTAEAQATATIGSVLAGAATTVANQQLVTTIASTEQAQATQTAIAGSETAAAQTAIVQSTQTADRIAQVQADQTTEVRTQAKTGVFNDFEFASTWRRGDEANGTFERTTAQVYQGRYAGQISYQFPAAGNDYVVFLWSQLLGGKPNQITVWVYGDGLGHFLNVWLKDSQNETWQFSFGQIKHRGWQQMAALISPNQPWPAGHIDGPNNGVVDYPISFQGLALDDGADNYIGSGVIYLDDLASGEGFLPPTPTLAPTSMPVPPITFRADRLTLGAGECTLLIWDVVNVKAVFLNGEGVPGQSNRQICPAATTTYTLLVVLRDDSTTNKLVTVTVQ